MNRPDTPYEAASYDLKQFRERRMQDRRMTPRAGMDRRQNSLNGGGHDARPEIIDQPREN